jgi:hypothetical protein
MPSSPASLHSSKLYFFVFIYTLSPVASLPPGN